MGTEHAISELDELYMRQALALADAAAALGEVPVGAVVVYDQQIIGRGHNRQITDSDPSAHAEVVALREAAAERQNYRLTDAILYSTIEPCTMCLGTSIHARVARIVFGALEPRAGAMAQLEEHATGGKRFNHVPSVTSGCLGAECGERLTQFFRAKRAAQTSNDARAISTSHIANRTSNGEPPIES